MRALFVALAFATCGLAPAAAQPSAAAAYRQGAFLQAAAIGEAGAEAGDLSLAARALLAEAVTGRDADVDALVLRAEANARGALSAAPHSIDARINLALALGIKGRRASVADIVRHGYAREGRALLAEAVARAPEQAMAHALIGGWNLEIVRRGGRAGAAYYGASRRAGVAAFERARALAPDDAAIAYQYAVALLELDAERYAQKASALLADARGCTSHDAFEARMKAQAAQVAAVLAVQGGEAAARMATARVG